MSDRARIILIFFFFFTIYRSRSLPLFPPVKRVDNLGSEGYDVCVAVGGCWDLGEEKMRAMRECQSCGARYEAGEVEYTYPNYFFSSQSFPKGSYTTPALVEAADELLLTCPRDEGESPEGFQAGSTPSGGSMYSGSDRFTAGDETHPSKEEL